MTTTTKPSTFCPFKLELTLSQLLSTKPFSAADEPPPSFLSAPLHNKVNFGSDKCDQMLEHKEAQFWTNAALFFILKLHFKVAQNIAKYLAYFCKKFFVKTIKK